MLRSAILSTLVLLISIATGMAQQAGEISYEDDSSFPGGKQGERIQELIAAYNANDPAAITAFIRSATTEDFQAIAPMEAHQGAFLSARRQTGEMVFHGIRRYTPPRPNETIVIYPNQQFGTWNAVTIRFDSTAEQRISSLRFSSARTPTNVEAPPPFAAEELPKRIGELMDRLCAADVFSGAILVAKGDEVCYEKACGEASKRFHVANNLDTKFNLGSMNKMFTATAIMQLVEAGKLRLDDRIDRYVDESWLPREMTGQITVHQLLSHTSGLGSYFTDAFWNGSRANYRSLPDFKPLLKDEKLAFTPGEGFRYSNTGMLILGVIVEKVSGQDYFDYIREHIYRPAGMANTDAYEMDQPVENLAMGYIPAPGSPYGWTNNLFQHVIKGGPAGGGFSNVRDLHRFALMLLNGQLVSPATLKKMWTSHSEERYGYGFSVEDGNAAVGKVVGHGGGFPGLNGNLDIFLDKGYIVAVLSNYDQGASPVARRIYEMIGMIAPSPGKP